jgi:hypothetical protein
VGRGAHRAAVRRTARTAPLRPRPYVALSCAVSLDGYL